MVLVEELIDIIISSSDGAKASPVSLFTLNMCKTAIFQRGHLVERRPTHPKVGRRCGSGRIEK